MNVDTAAIMVRDGTKVAQGLSDAPAPTLQAARGRWEFAGRSKFTVEAQRRRLLRSADAGLVTGERIPRT